LLAIMRGKICSFQSASEAAEFLKIRRDNFLAHVDPRYSRRKDRVTGFVEKVDFVYQPDNRVETVWLTVDCFKQTAMN
jgi:hypothetical protein